MRTVITRALNRLWRLAQTETGHSDGFDEGAVIWDALKDRKPGTMIDVGAHNGSAHQVYLQNGWNVYAFEPDPDNRSRLRTHPRLVVSDIALGARDQQGVDFYASPESTGISSLSPFTSGHSKRCTVSVRTLSAMVDEYGIKRCDYLKIDTEGHDLFVLQGAPWDRFRPDVVMCEFEDRKTKDLGYSYQTIGEFLLSLGYVVFMSEWEPIVRYGVTHTWRRVVRYPAATAHRDAWGNFLAIQPSVRIPNALNRLEALSTTSAG